MNRNIWAAPRTPWRGLTVVGLLVTFAFLGHDLGMTSVAAHEELQIRPRTLTPSHIRVVHGAEDTAASNHLGSQHQHAVSDESPQSQCEISRAGVATNHETLGATLQTILGAIAPIAGWHDDPRPLWAADVTFPSSREQRTWFQVFLI